MDVDGTGWLATSLVLSSSCQGHVSGTSTYRMHLDTASCHPAQDTDFEFQHEMEKATDSTIRDSSIGIHRAQQRLKKNTDGSCCTDFVAKRLW